MRYGEGSLKRRFASLFVGDLEASFDADSWVKLKATCLGTGKVSDNMVEESITAAENVTTLTLAANVVNGSTAATRLASVQRIRVELTHRSLDRGRLLCGIGCHPRAITITCARRCCHEPHLQGALHPPPAESGTAWMTFPARVAEDAAARGSDHHQAGRGPERLHVRRRQAVYERALRSQPSTSWPTT